LRTYSPRRFDGESAPYIAGWGEAGALDAVNEFAAPIDRQAREIENALRGVCGTPKQ
jgi:hypothetical protein